MPVKKWCLRFGVLAAIAVAGFGLSRLPDEGVSPGGPPQSGIPQARATPAPVPDAMPRPVHEDHGRLEMIRLPPQPPLPVIAVEPLFDPNARLRLDQTADLKFAVRDRASGLPLSGHEVTASLLHNGEPSADLEAREVEDGVFEVPFTPHGPGQFTVVLNIDGIPAATRKVGVAGTVGGAAQTDQTDPLLAVDPRAPRARTSGRWRIR